MSRSEAQLLRSRLSQLRLQHPSKDDVLKQLNVKRIRSTTISASLYLQNQLEQLGSERIYLPQGAAKIVKTIVAERIVELLFSDCDEEDKRAEVYSKDLYFMVTNFPEICLRNYKMKKLSQGLELYYADEFLPAQLQNEKEKNLNELKSPTLLWLIVWQNAPLHLVKAVFMENPDAVYVPGGHDDMFPFHLACAQSRLDVMQFLYLGFPDAIRIQDKGGQLPLYYPFETEETPDISLVQFLLDRYPEAALAKGNHGRTALISAMVSDYRLQIVESIVAACPATISVLDGNGNNALETVCSLLKLRDSSNIIPYLDLLVRNNPEGPAALQLSPDDELTPLELAARFHSPSTVCWLLECCAPLGLFMNNDDPLLLLHHAAVFNKADTVEMLAARYPFMVLLVDENENTVLHSACSFGERWFGARDGTDQVIEVLTVLIRIQPNFLICRDSDGQTPLHIAQDNFASSEVIDFLEMETRNYILSSGPHTKQRLHDAQNCKKVCYHPTNYDVGDYNQDDSDIFCDDHYSHDTNKNNKTNKTNKTKKTNKNNKTNKTNKTSKTNKTNKTNKTYKTNKTNKINKNDKNNKKCPTML